MESDSRLVFGVFELAEEPPQLWRIENGSRSDIHLTALGGRLLVYLAQNAKRWLSVQTLAEEVWNDPETEANAIHAGISRLRKKVPECKGLIQGKQGTYRLNVDVSRTSEPNESELVATHDPDTAREQLSMVMSPAQLDTNTDIKAGNLTSPIEGETVIPGPPSDVERTKSQSQNKVRLPDKSRRSDRFQFDLLGCSPVRLPDKLWRSDSDTPQSERTEDAEDEKHAAERRWRYIQTHPIRGIAVLFLLKRNVGFDWFCDVLNETQLVFSRDERGYRLGQVFASAPAPNTKESSRASDQPLCSFWEVYEAEPGYWCRRITPTPRKFSVVAGFEAVVPWSMLGLPQIGKLEKLALLTDIGISFPPRAYDAGIEKCVVNFVGDTFSFVVQLSDHDLSFRHEMAQVLPTNMKDLEFRIGSQFSGVELLEMFFRELLPRPKSEQAESKLGTMGLCGPIGKSILFYPTMPLLFVEAPESKDYIFTVRMPGRIEADVHIQHLEEKNQVSPGDPESYVMLIAFYSPTGRLQDTLRCLFARPRAVAVLLLRGRLQDTLRCLFTPIDKASPNADVHGLMADTLRHLGRFDEAISHFERAAALAPDNAKAQTGLGACLHELGKNDDALIHFQAAARMDSSNAAYQANLGRALIDLERYSEAITAWQRAVSLEPDNAQHVMALGMQLHSVDRLEEAAIQFEKATHLALKSAEAAFRHALKLAPNNAGMLAIAGAALKLAPNNAGMLAIAGAAFANLGKFAEAAEWLEQSLRLDPNNTAVQSNLKQVREMQGKRCLE